MALALPAGWILQSTADSVIPPLQDLHFWLGGSQLSDAVLVRKGFEEAGTRSDEDPGGWFVDYRFRHHSQRGLVDRVKRERVSEDFYRRLTRLDAISVRYAKDRVDVFRLDGNPSIGFHTVMLLLPLGIALFWLFGSVLMFVAGLNSIRLVLGRRSVS